MKRLLTPILSLTFLVSIAPISSAWDTQTTNPFPGTAFGGEVPGYTVQVPCSPNDCGIGIVPVVECPPWSAADGGSFPDLGYAKRFCRASWLPPTTQADDEDFRNRQQLAIAAATLESQNWNSTNLGLQKCVTWGPIVHANGISTASGGVCANVVGTLPDGSTKQVAPSPIGASTQPTIIVDSQTAGSLSPSVTPASDYSAYGIGKPFTTVIKGLVSTSGCPSGYQAASNELSGTGLTECWPGNAWSAWSIGGATWQEFKTSNGSTDALQAESQRIQTTALRALALQEAQRLANETIGLKRCSNWSAFGQSGQECAYIPIQNNLLGLGSRIETSTVTTPQDSNTVSSSPGISLAAWQASESYTAFVCPSGYGKKSTIDLNGTATTSDDKWTVACVSFNSAIDTLTATALETQTIQVALSDSSTAIALGIQTIQFSGSTSEISRISSALDLETSESNAISKVLNQITSIKSTYKLVKVSLPNSPELVETAVTLTPSVCSIKGLIVVPKKSGTCKVSYGFTGESGNSFETVKKVIFKK